MTSTQALEEGYRATGHWALSEADLIDKFKDLEQKGYKVVLASCPPLGVKKDEEGGWAIFVEKRWVFDGRAAGEKNKIKFFKDKIKKLTAEIKYNEEIIAQSEKWLGDNGYGG